MGQIRLEVNYFYSLTYRQFVNTVNGFQKYEDVKSRERWLITRKLMYGSMSPYAKENFKETDIIKFPWEEKALIELSEKEHNLMLEYEQKSIAFFDNYDKKKAQKLLSEN